jgi:hypothetical protein
LQAQLAGRNAGRQAHFFETPLQTLTVKRVTTFWYAAAAAGGASISRRSAFVLDLGS